MKPSRWLLIAALLTLAHVAPPDAPRATEHERELPSPPVRPAPSATSRPRRAVQPLPLLGLIVMAIGALYVGWSAFAFPIGACSMFLLFIVARELRSTRALSRSVQRARREQWSGDIEAALTMLNREGRSHPALHAETTSLLAREARFTEALRACAAGLHELAPDSPQTPLLLFTRALCLAATDRIDEARAAARELGDVAPLHPLAGAARRSIDIVAAVRGEDISRLEALVSERHPNNAVPMRVELLAELARARASVSHDLDAIALLERKLDGRSSPSSLDGGCPPSSSRAPGRDTPLPRRFLASVTRRRATGGRCGGRRADRLSSPSVGYAAMTWRSLNRSPLRP